MFLGISRSRLYRRSLAGAVLGAMPPIVVGSVAGVLVVAFLCRSEQAALFLLLNIGMFAIGVIVALILVFSLCAVLSIGKRANMWGQDNCRDSETTFSLSGNC